MDMMPDNSNYNYNGIYNYAQGQEIPQSTYEQKVKATAHDLENYVKFPFPHRFKVYNKAYELWKNTLSIVRRLPKDLRSNFGTETLLKTHMALLKDLDRYNNEPNREKRTKGWKNCLINLNMLSTGYITCLQDGYSDAKRLNYTIRNCYDLTKMILNLIKIECLKMQSESTNTPITKEMLNQSAAEIEALIMGGFYNKDRKYNLNKNGGKKKLKDPSPGLNPSNNNINAVYNAYGISVPTDGNSNRPVNLPNNDEIVSYKGLCHLGRIYMDMLKEEIEKATQQLEQYNAQYQNYPQYQIPFPSVPVCSNNVDMMHLPYNDDRIINRAYNVATGLVDPTGRKQTIVARDYFKNARVAKYDNDAAQARKEFKNKIAFQ